MRNSSPKSKEMNIALDRLQYLSQAAPLEKQLTFHELQNRPLGFQTAIPRDPIGEAMNSLEFKSMEGAMYENAAYAGQMMRSEQMKDVLVSEAAARHGLPHQVIQEFQARRRPASGVAGHRRPSPCFSCRRGHAPVAGAAD